MTEMLHLSALMPLLPELTLIVGALALLMIGAISGEKSSGGITALSIVLLAGVGLLIAIAPPGKASAFGGSFVVDDFARFAKLLMLAGSAGALFLALDFLRKAGRGKFEYPVLVLLASVGMMMMISSGDLIALYLGLELMSLSLYVLAAFDRDNARSTEAGLKYFVLGALSSGMLLYGASLIYGFTGTVDLRRHRKGCGGGRRSASPSAWCSCWRACASRFRRCRSICGRRTSTKARRPRSRRSSPPRRRSRPWRCSCASS